MKCLLIFKLFVIAGIMFFPYICLSYKLIDEIHFFHVNGYPSMQAANDNIELINSQAGTNLKDWDDVYKGSFAIEAKKKFGKFDLGLIVEYSSGALKDNKKNEEMGTAVNLYQDWDVIATGINSYYNFNRDGKWNPFIGGGPIYYAKIKSKTKIDISTDFFLEKITSTYTDNGWGFSAFAGIQWNIDDHWSMDFLVNYTWANFKKTIIVHDSILGDYPLDAEANFSGPGIALGVSYKF